MDIVQRLRDAEPCQESVCKLRDVRSGCCCASAADEIEQLRSTLKDILFVAEHGTPAAGQGPDAVTKWIAGRCRRHANEQEAKPAPQADLMYRFGQPTEAEAVKNRADEPRSDPDLDEQMDHRHRDEA